MMLGKIFGKGRLRSADGAGFDVWCTRNAQLNKSYYFPQVAGDVFILLSWKLASGQKRDKFGFKEFCDFTKL